MSLEQLNSITTIKQFLDGTQAVAFSIATHKQARYQWVQKAQVKHQYLLLGKADRGAVTRYLMKVTGYSLAQTKRLIRQYANTGTVMVKSAHRNGFKRTYTNADIRLLAAMDERHGQPSGPVLKKLCERATNALVKESMNGWPIFRCLTCITCAVQKPINGSAVL